MLQYFIKRILLAILTLLCITFVVYGLVRAMPGSPAIVQEGFNPDKKMSVADRKRIEKYFALDKHWTVGYVIWMQRLILWGDLGRSMQEKEPVVHSIFKRLGPTLRLSITSLILTYLLSIPLGLYSSMRRGKWDERITSFLLYALYSFPSFIAALLLLLVFYQYMPWDCLRLEPGLHGSNYDQLSFFGRLFDEFRHMLLPTICYTYGSLAYLSRFIKSNMEEVIRQDYIRTAKAKGVSPINITVFHAFRNTLIPFVTLIGLTLPGLVGGSVILETIFSWPGIGQLFFQAIGGRDYFLIMGLVLMFSVLTLLGQLIADMLYGIVDPRVTVK